MLRKFQFFIYFLPFIITGCAVMQYREQLLTLKAVGESQEEIERYINQKESLFYKLRGDVKENRLEQGVVKEDIITTYGEPIISKEVRDNPPIKEALVYRHPTAYFSSDKVLLYFDRTDKLVHWEYRPSQVE